MLRCRLIVTICSSRCFSDFILTSFRISQNNMKWQVYVESALFFFFFFVSFLFFVFLFFLFVFSRNKQIFWLYRLKIVCAYGLQSIKLNKWWKSYFRNQLSVLLFSWRHFVFLYKLWTGCDSRIRHCYLNIERTHISSHAPTEMQMAVTLRSCFFRHTQRPLFLSRLC